MHITLGTSILILLSPLFHIFRRPVLRPPGINALKRARTALFPHFVDANEEQCRLHTARCNCCELLIVARNVRTANSKRDPPSRHTIYSRVVRSSAFVFGWLQRQTNFTGIYCPTRYLH